MSKLIDNIKDYERTTIKINGEWYIAKPIQNTTLKNKIKDCIKILRGKAIAVHFKEDEKE